MLTCRTYSYNIIINEYVFAAFIINQAYLPFLASFVFYLWNDTLPSLMASRDIMERADKEDIVIHSCLVFTCFQDDRPRATS